MFASSTPMPQARLERWAWLPVARADLADIRAMPPGEARRDEAVTRMRAATSAGAAPARDALAGALQAAGLDARVDVREHLWLDGSAVVQVVSPDPEAAARIDDVLAAAGARVLDPDDLPRGTGVVEQPARRSAQRDREAGRQWFADAAGFTAAHAAGLTGEGVRVAVVDSGIDPSHPDLAPALARGTHLDRFGGPVRSGHGTFVAGILAGTATGLAPGVDLSSSRTYGATFGDHRGADEPSRIAQRVNAVRALQDALAPPDGRRGADILVTSWGILDQPGVPATDYDAAMATIAAAGAVTVAAAGNDGARDGRPTIAVPAQLEDVLAVGGVDRDLRWHPRASSGPSPRTGFPKPDLAAPVTAIRSTTLGGGRTDTSGNDDGGFAGTSAAAPIAAAAIALLTQTVHDRGGASPDLEEVRRVLPQLTIDADDPGIDPRTGLGAVDVSRIDEAADQIIAAR